MNKHTFLAVLYSLREVKRQLKDVRELYDMEVNSNLKKSEVLKDLQTRLYTEHVERMKLVITLSKAKACITDKKLLGEIDELLEQYK